MNNSEDKQKFIPGAGMASGAAAGGPPIELDGYSLTIEALEQIALHGAPVAIAPEAEERVKASRRIMLELAAEGTPIYGVNRGVGVNKDQEVASGFAETYNRNLLYSHAVGIGPQASESQVRAILAARLNSLLLGHAGAGLDVVRMYRDMLNAGIHPVLPLRGSVGAADITLLSHIGLAMMGEGEVTCGCQLVPAQEALQKAGLTPVTPGARDGLAIVGSNALSSGLGALALGDAARLLEMADAVYALSLEAIEGSYSPLDEALYRKRPFEGASASAAFVRGCLEGGDVARRGETGKIQDPLSFRSASHVHGAARDALEYARGLLLVQLNSSEDNPCLLVEERRIAPSSHFDTTTWTLAFEMLGIALSHVSKISCYRMIKLGTSGFTGLNRFLSPNPAETIAFATIQKTFASLDAEIRHLSNPVSADYLSLSGDMEDHANNTPLVVRKTADIIERLYCILAMEAIHAAQAVDLRGSVRLGKGSQALYEAIRSEVAVLLKDRPLSLDIEAICKLLVSQDLLGTIKQAIGS